MASATATTAAAISVDFHLPLYPRHEAIHVPLLRWVQLSHRRRVEQLRGAVPACGGNALERWQRSDARCGRRF